MKLDLIADGTSLGEAMCLMGFFVTKTSLTSGYAGLLDKSQWPKGYKAFIVDHENRQAYRIAKIGILEELTPTHFNALSTIVRAADRSNHKDQFETLKAAKVFVARKGWKHTKHVFVKCRNGKFTIVFNRPGS